MPSTTWSPVFDPKDTASAIEFALDKNQMEGVFTSRARERFGENVQLKDLRIEVLRRHSNRCVLRYRINAFDRRHEKDVQWGVIGKVVRVELGEKVYHNMQQLWENGFSRHAKDRISMPEPLEFLPHLSMLLQEEVPGFAMRAIMRQSVQPEHLRQVARTLAKLHKCPISPGRLFKVRDHLMRCHPKHEFLSLACPELSPTIDYIVEQAYRIEAALSDIEHTPLHGDFHLGQVHLENGQAWLVDFDALSYGDPASDLGNLMVFLTDKARRKPEVNALIEAFLDEYFSVMDRKIAARIPLYEGLTRLRRACKALRLQDEGWQHKVKRMVEQGKASVDEMTRKHRLSGRRPSFAGAKRGAEEKELIADVV
jgi:Ser/Thr protein kinase RdoA (MazF antagonist)